MPIPPTILSHCTFTLDYGTEKCQAKLMSDGTLQGSGCGDSCNFIMQKSGAGYPKFHWKRKLFAGDVELPNQDWQDY